MMQKTVKCPICGEPYKFYPFSAADQSACPACVRKAESNMRRDSMSDKDFIEQLRGLKSV